MNILQLFEILQGVAFLSYILWGLPIFLDFIDDAIEHFCILFSVCYNSCTEHNPLLNKTFNNSYTFEAFFFIIDHEGTVYERNSRFSINIDVVREDIFGQLDGYQLVLFFIGTVELYIQIAV